MWKCKLLVAVFSLVAEVEQVLGLVGNKLTGEAKTKWEELTAVVMILDLLWDVERFIKSISDIMEGLFFVIGEVIKHQNVERQKMIFTAVEGLVDETKAIYSFAVAHSPEGTEIGIEEWVKVQNYLECLREMPSEFIKDLEGLKDTWLALAGKL
ncbi:MAG TPA: hypothetical protein PLR18_04785, partial [bacterium]|nr:hypothetical protein [bacterium]